MILRNHIGFITAGILLLITITYRVSAQQSVLSSGNWYKLAVTADGVYKIDEGLLKKMGIDVGKIDPRKIKIFGNGGGMLPQANNAVRPYDLIENAIVVNGEDDGKFNSGDYILFYAQGADRNNYIAGKQLFFYEHNLYDEKNFYFLTLGETNGKRIATADNTGNSAATINQFDAFVYHELDNTNELNSGREWFGENFYLNPEQTLKFDINGIAENTSIKIVSDVMGQSYTGSSFKLFFNTVAVGEQYIASISDSQYALKGRHKRDTLIFSSANVSAITKVTQELTYQYIKSAGYSKAYLDYCLISYKRKLALYGNQTIFVSGESQQHEKSNFQIDQLQSNCIIWDVTDPSEPINQPYTLATATGSFVTATTSLKKFIVFNTTTLSPQFVAKVANQNLHGLATPNLLIVTYPLFKDEALRFAAHRQNHSNWSVAVVTTDEVFNEFSSGRKDVSAIRDFAKHSYDKSPSTLRALLLFGRGSYDYKDRLTDNTNFVPTYESRNSLEPLETYSSDDYYAFLEDSEGNWLEDPAEDYTLDIGIGRFPVKTIEEAQHVVDKIIDYDTNPDAFGQWRKEITFVADDADGNVHQSQSDKLALKVEATHPEFNTRRIFLDAYPQIVKPSGQTSPECNKAIVDAIDRGSIIINYTGHGGEKLWAQEKIFDNLTIDKLDNKTYPLFVTATCEFGRNDDPEDISSAELAVIREKSGAIGMVTTARPVNSSTNFELNQAFYDALFQRESGSFLTVGEIFKRTKNNSTSGVSNRNFSLLGDPSMKLAFPTYKIELNEIINNEGYDTLKALSTITVKGEIQTTMGEKADDFSGILQAKIFDKQTSFTTLGDENTIPYNYKAWYNAIFRGSATITNGDFEFQFIVPKNIAYQVGNGKLSLYGSSTSMPIDASGADMSFVIGKSNTNPAPDDQAPVINLFMGDETFIDGGLVSSDTYLVGDLYDKNGINISGYGIGNSIIAILDGNETTVLNDYFDAAENDYTHGKIRYRMSDLAPGKHTLTLKAWDTYNNPGQGSITFIVSEGSDIKIEKFGNYPNPFSANTTLFFTHNHAGDDLDATIILYDLTGHIIKNMNFTIPASRYKVDLIELNAEIDFGKKLSPGLYLARLVVRSLSDGSKNEQVTKLIVLN